MASESDTLDIGRIRRRHEYPVADVQPRPTTDPALHPEAAALARARIEAIGAPQYPAEVKPETLPAVHTVELITDKQALAKHERAASAHRSATATTRTSGIPSAMRPMLTAVGIFFLVLLLFKSPIILSQLGYTLNGNKNTPAASTVSSNAVVPAADTITIPKINVQAPVNYIQSTAESDVLTALESGVVHYGNTALPGQAGNVVIFGHSSNDWWEPGNFKFVFVLLDKLAPGDQVTLDYNSHQYVYQVTGSQVVDPTDVAVVDPTTTPTLTLITCSPPGTSLKRLVVTAKQIAPDPNQATASTATTASSPTTGDLPSSAPDFLTQVKEGWDGIVHSISSLFGGDTSGTPATSPTPAGTSTNNAEIPVVK